MAAIATLTLDIVGRSDKLRAELVKSAKFTKSWSARTRQGLNSGARAFVGVGAAGAAAFSVIYTKAAEAADEIAKTSDKLGIGAVELQGLQHAAELTGVSTKTINKSLVQMTRLVSEAADGTGEASGALDKLNLNAKDLKELSPDQQFAAIADAIKQIKSQSEKVEIASDLFGARGTGLLNTLELGSEGLKNMAIEVDELGAALSRVELAKIESANDAFYRAKEATAGFGRVLAAEAAPLVTALSNAFVDSAREAGGFGVIARKVVDATVKGVGFAADVVWGLKIAWLGVRQAVAEFLNTFVQVYGKIAEFGGSIAEKLGFDSSSSNQVTLFAESFRETTASMRQDLEKIVREGPPSDAIKTFVENAQETADKAARAVAEKSKARIGDVYDSTDAGKNKRHAEETEELKKQHAERLSEVTAFVKGEAEIKDAALIAAFEKRKQIVTDARAQELIDEQRQNEIIAGLDKKLNDDRALLAQQAIEQRTEANATFWERYVTAAEDSLTNLDELAASTINNFSNGVGSALEEMVFDAESFSGAMQGLAENMGRSIVNALGKMAAEWLAYKLVQSLVTKATAASSGAMLTMQAQAMSAMAGLNAFTSTAAIPMVGPAAAPAAAAAAVAATQPMALTVGALSAASFAGAFDKGGYIKSGQFGLVGEIGPELVQGPMKITGRKKTEDILSRAGNSSNKVEHHHYHYKTDNTFTIDSPDPEGWRAAILKNKSFFLQIIEHELAQTARKIKA